MITESPRTKSMSEFFFTVFAVSNAEPTRTHLDTRLHASGVVFIQVVADHSNSLLHIGKDQVLGQE